MCICLCHFVSPRLILRTISLGNASARSGLWRNTHQIWDMMTTFGEVIDIYSPVHNRLIAFVSFKTEDALENALARKEASIGGTRILLSRAHFKDDNGAASFVSQTSFAFSTRTSSSAMGGVEGGSGRAGAGGKFLKYVRSPH